MASALPNFPPFNVNDSAVDIRWRKWTNRLENLLVGMDVKDKKRQRALLLHYAGEEVNEIFETLSDTGDDYATAKGKLTEYFAPKKNTEFEVYKFRQAKQQQDEGIDSFLTRLRQLSINCEFPDTDKEVKSQIIQGCSSSRLRRRALREDQSLENLLKLARAMEFSDKQASEIEQTENTNAIRSYKRRSKKTGNRMKNKFKYSDKDTKVKKQTCRNCGGQYPHTDSPCPAKGKLCHACKKLNHFASVCRSKHKSVTKSVNQIDENQSFSENSDSDEEYLFGVQTNEQVNAVHQKQPKTTVIINGLYTEFLIDTGSSINVIDEGTFSKLKDTPQLKKSDTKVFTYGSNSNLDMKGKFEGTIETNSRITTATVYVVKGNYGNLLGYKTLVDLQVIPCISSLSSKHEQLCEKYKSIFNGIGKLKDTQINIHIDSTVQPVIQPHRRIPFHVRKQVEAELDRLEKLDIIEKVEGPTPWVSPIVVAPKPRDPSKIRLCVDMRLPNEAVKRERHITPTIDDMILDLNGATVFSKLDLSSGYHQLELNQSSRYITTFSTHVGLRRYKRLIFGLSSSAEIFQNALQNALSGLDGVRNISDDIIVFGKSQEEHDRNLEAVFARLKEKNLTLNRQKCEFNKDKLVFYGYIFSKNGLSADPEKVKAIKDAPPPTNVTELRSFLGMTNYVSRFIPTYSTITAPLRKLTKAGVAWEWTESQQNAFETLKRDLTSDLVVAYFDPRKESTLMVDASPVGLAAILTQEGKIIAYASKALSEVEQRYSQTEKEALAIVWGCEHFHLYLYGHKFNLVSDCRPLEVVFNNSNSKPKARIERWRLRLQGYNFKIIFKEGKKNVADYISRHVGTCKDTKQSEYAEEYVKYIIENAVPKSMSLDEICESTNRDTLLQNVIECVESGQWYKYKNEQTMDIFSRLREELTVRKMPKGSVLLRDNRLVIPKELQKKVIELAHQGHSGMVRTKSLLREKVWFPYIDKQVEDMCKSCVPCLASVPKNESEPLKMSELPDGPWAEVSADFYGPLSSNTYLLVIVDDYSRYPVVEIVSSTSAKAVIPHLDKVFSMFGVPQVMKTDNGPPWNGHDMVKFAEYMGFKHRKITPLHPQSNAEAERFMSTIGKTIKASNVENKNWKQELYSFLRNYIATPHCTTSVPPATLLFNRNIRTKLPEITVKMKDKRLRERDRYKKMKMKIASDTKKKAKKCSLKPGDTVLVKQQKRNKITTPFNHKPYEITSKKGSMITAEREDHRVTRDSSFFKHVKNAEPVNPSVSNETSSKNNEEDENDSVIVEENTPELRRSNRERRPPSYLKDYVCK